MKTYLDGIKNINKVGNAVDEIYICMFLPTLIFMLTVMFKNG